MSGEKIIQADTQKLQVLTFAVGCFWGVEEAFNKVNGNGKTITIII
jgi:peptide methionine sulfoxide reductase MsrA